MKYCFKKILAVSVFVLSFLSLGQTCFSQTEPANTREEIDKRYDENIKKSRINGVYIPKDIDDAFQDFLHLSPQESLESFKLTDEDIVAKKLHFGIGRWMIVNWNFYEGSRLSHILREKGILHPDDMADYLIRVFHRMINDKKPDDEGLIEQYAKKRNMELKEKGKIHFDNQ